MNSAAHPPFQVLRTAAVELYVPDMHCASCADRIELAIRQVLPEAELSSNPTRQLVHLTLPNEVPLSSVLEAVEDAGYTPTPTAAQQYEDGWRELKRDHLKRIGVAGIAMMQVMMVSLALYLADDTMSRVQLEMFRWTGLLFCTPVVGYSAWPFFRNAGLSLRHWFDTQAAVGLAMDVPVALAIGAAYAASLVATLSGEGQVYFDSVTMFTFLLLSARYLEQSLRGRLSRLDQLLDLLPDHVERLSQSGADQIPLADVHPGDRLLVKPGQRLPVDGRISAGSTDVDEATLTGESEPRLRSIGDRVYAGTLNLTQPITIEATRAGSDTRLGSIQALAKRAEADKPPVVVTTDRIARVFVIAVLAVATATFLIWQWIDPGRAFWSAVAVLVVSCPCALSLATPTAITAATVALRRRGFVITRPRLLDRLALVTDVVFDKTGTLTTGRPELIDIQTYGSTTADCLRDAASLENCFEHPYAAAFKKATKGIGLIAIEHPQLVPGQGIQGHIDSALLRLGRPEFAGMSASPDTDGATELCLSRDGVAQARFLLRDALREDTEAMLGKMRTAGLAPHVVSGDADSATRAVAERLDGIDYHASASPEHKLMLLQTLQSLDSGARSVLMVGDGINDVPSLAAATVSITPLDATDLAKQNSDALLLARSLMPLVDAVMLARRTRRIIRQNLSWAAAYNLISIPLAAFGFIPPWAAALGMSSSSLLVTLNALRLVNGGNRWKA
jgi:Cu2+-exporting ATPase